jgi:hypothetical protein
MLNSTTRISGGYISSAELYRLPEAKRRLAMGRYSFARLRKAGLPILRVGKNYYVEGAAVLDAIKVAAQQQQQAQGCNQNSAMSTIGEGEA